MFNPALIKPVIGFTVGLCTSSTVGRIIRANAVPVTNFQKVQVIVAGAALGSAAGSIASKQIIDDIEKVEIAVQSYKEAQKAK